jgi:hypothetical protein
LWVLGEDADDVIAGRLFLFYCLLEIIIHEVLL